ncbi:MAG: PaaI family thioesterase [Armatimonadota bacterium]|nr:PaaI family thioesterase [Armatimonadota bacterium]
MRESILELSDDGGCFGCGKKNPIGLKLDFELRDGEYITEFTPGPEHQGFINITHGGILATLADEAMAKLVWIKGFKALTAEMSIKFKRPAETGKPLTIIGTIEKVEGKLIFCKAEIRKPDGTVVAEATAKMVKV